MAAQVLAEMSQEAKDQKLLLQIYNSLLFDFRIWCKSEFFVQVHVNHYIYSLKNQFYLSGAVRKFELTRFKLFRTILGYPNSKFF
jgi:hypothetical protein